MARQPWEVTWAGAQRDLLAGDVRGHVDIGAMRHLPRLYALGPLEGARGEVSIFDGAPSIAEIREGRVRTEATWDRRACFLVWAQVPHWHQVVLVNGASDEAALVAAVVSAGAALGLDVSRPFPFRVSGRAEAIRFHVLDKRDDLPHTPERHESAKTRGTIEREPVEVVGFYSECHRGIFTPNDANVHMHVRTTDGIVSGHLETVRRLADATIWVPSSSPGDPNPATQPREAP